MVEDVFKTKPDPGRRDYGRYRFLTPIARMAFRMAIIATPTSPKTASHMLAMPSAASTRISNLMPSAKMMFCQTIDMVLRATRIAREMLDGLSSMSTTSAASIAASEQIGRAHV